MRRLSLRTKVFFLFAATALLIVVPALLLIAQAVERGVYDRSGLRSALRDPNQDGQRGVGEDPFERTLRGGERRAMVIAGAVMIFSTTTPPSARAAPGPWPGNCSTRIAPASSG